MDTATARVYGEAVAELPRDLYIPPDALEVCLDAFEGPLDLLLYLIRKENIDVLDIPMAELARQYVGYIEVLEERRFDLAAEYLLMAAWLIDIKSRMLLPRPQTMEQEEEDPRAELVRRLLEYEQMKKAAARLDALPRAERDFAVVTLPAPDPRPAPPPKVRADDLLQTLADLFRRQALHAHHRIRKDELSVREFMTRLLQRLVAGHFFAFTRLLREGAPKAEAVVTFLAVLELTREGMVAVDQNEPLSPLYVRLAGHDLPQ